MSSHPGTCGRCWERGHNVRSCPKPEGYDPIAEFQASERERLGAPGGVTVATPKRPAPAADEHVVERNPHWLALRGVARDARAYARSIRARTERGELPRGGPTAEWLLDHVREVETFADAAGLLANEPATAAAPRPASEGVVPCDFAVQATDYEALCIWKEWHERVSWEQEYAGTIREVGRVGDDPVCVQLTWNVVAGRRVVFYWASSRVVDYRMVDAWVRAHAMTPNATHGDAMNFHVVAHAIERANEAARG
jgi:hypothetical protein